MMWGYGWGNGPGAFGVGGALVMMFIGLILLAGVVLLIVWAVRQGQHQHPHAAMHAPMHPGQQPPAGQQWMPAQPGMMMPGGQGGGPTGTPGGAPNRDPAVDAARERYARGEISKEQLDQIMKDLGY